MIFILKQIDKVLDVLLARIFGIIKIMCRGLEDQTLDPCPFAVKITSLTKCVLGLYDNFQPCH